MWFCSRCAAQVTDGRCAKCGTITPPPPEAAGPFGGLPGGSTIPPAAPPAAPLITPPTPGGLPTISKVVIGLVAALALIVMLGVGGLAAWYLLQPNPQILTPPSIMDLPPDIESVSPSPAGPLPTISVKTSPTAKVSVPTVPKPLPVDVSAYEQVDFASPTGEILCGLEESSASCGFASKLPSAKRPDSNKTCSEGAAIGLLVGSETQVNCRGDVRYFPVVENADLDAWGIEWYPKQGLGTVSCAPTADKTKGYRCAAPCCPLVER